MPQSASLWLPYGIWSILRWLVANKASFIALFSKMPHNVWNLGLWLASEQRFVACPGLVRGNHRELYTYSASLVTHIQVHNWSLHCGNIELSLSGSSKPSLKRQQNIPSYMAGLVCTGHFYEINCMPYFCDCMLQKCPLFRMFSLVTNVTWVVHVWHFCVLGGLEVL